MKFRDPKTREVFEDIDTAIWKECGRRDPCDTNCPLFKQRKHSACRDYVISHPAEAARLMGYEVVEEDNRPETGAAQTSGTDKPISAYTIGEVKEICRTREGEDPCIECRFYDTGRYSCIFGAEEMPENWDFTGKPNFTDDEVADAKVLARALLADGFERDKNGDMFTVSSVSDRTLLDSRMFPSLRPGQTVKLETIVGDG